MKVYRIKNWDDHYENSRSRAMEVMRWVPIPNKFDGDGYTELVSGQDGAALYGCWVAIIGVAGRCHERGTLLRDNRTPHNAETISRLTRLPAIIVQKTLEKASSVEVGWLEIIEIEGDAPPYQAPVTNVTPAHHESAVEGNRIEENIAATNTLRQRPLSWPTLEQAKAKAEMILLPEAEAENFWNHFESTGWKDKNGQNVHNWQAKLGTWKATFEAQRATGRAVATGKGQNRPPTIHELKTVKEAKEGLMAEIQRKHTHENAFGLEWKDPAKRREWLNLKKEVKELTEQIAKAL